jgi:hypothetical protein
MKLAFVRHCYLRWSWAGTAGLGRNVRLATGVTLAPGSRVSR